MSGPLTVQLATAERAREPGLPRLLRGIAEAGEPTIGRHVAVHGPLPAIRHSGRRLGRGRGPESPLIEEIARAGLLGHGGAAFPLATKMRAVGGARGRAIVLANATEGEPASLKDQTLLELAPHLVLDGAALAAEALGAEEAVIAVCELADGALAALSGAIAERAGAGGPALRMLAVPAHYVAGQESALVNYVNGGPAKPTFTPPLPFEQGVRRRPTLVNNVETLAHLALVARHGADWFRELGTSSQPGSALVTLSGPLVHPGVYEIEHGSSLSALIEAAGGATEPLGGALLGGYAGGWIGPQHLHGVALSNEHLAVHGAMLGPGVVVLLPASACPVAEAARLARWLSDQSAGQCGPCVNGLDALAATVEQVAQGVARGKPAQRIDRLAALSARRGACRHPDGAVNVLFSALETFRTEFADHARNGPCEACARPPQLPLPVRPVSARTLRRKEAGA